MFCEAQTTMEPMHLWMSFQCMLSGTSRAILREYAYQITAPTMMAFLRPMMSDM